MTSMVSINDPKKMRCWAQGKGRHDRVCSARDIWEWGSSDWREIPSQARARARYGRVGITTCANEESRLRMRTVILLWLRDLNVLMKPSFDLTVPGQART